MLTLRHLSKTFANGVTALHPTDLTVEAGERLVLLGPSGSGKSTLLRLIVGLDEPTTGEVWRDGVRIDTLPPHKRGVAFLPQRPALYPRGCPSSADFCSLLSGRSICPCDRPIRLSPMKPT